VGNIILFHHEHYDGSGYPQGLSRDAIPFEARIFALADALDAITAPRPYRRAQSFPDAKKEISSHAGAQFDPKTVDAFNALKPEKWERIRFETTSLLPNFAEFAELIRTSGK
jgi:HD-GYP domain-containing protein (c-di-GMP phosphodiesterase class II)